MIDQKEWSGEREKRVKSAGERIGGGGSVVVRTPRAGVVVCFWCVYSMEQSFKRLQEESEIKEKGKNETYFSQHHPHLAHQIKAAQIEESETH